MKLIAYIGPGTGPVVPAGVLSAAYDFSGGAVEMPEADAELLLIHCGRSYRDITNSQAESYLVTRQADSTVPVLSTAAVNGKTLVLTYTEASTLDSDDYALVTDYAVLVDAVPNVVKKVLVAGRTVILTLTTAVTHGQTVTVGYTQQVAGAKQIKDVKGNKAANLVAQAVTNNTPEA